MSNGFSSDPELEKSTNKVMMWGVGLMVAMALAFPVYLSFEPEAREDSRDENLASLADEGQRLWGFNCASCHGENGEGLTAPALNSKEFLQSATDEQIAGLISVGIPGTAMPAFSQDFAGPLTSEQIKGLVTYIRSWEEDAPNIPDWRDPQPAAEATGGATADAVAEVDDVVVVDPEAVESDAPVQEQTQNTTREQGG